MNITEWKQEARKDEAVGRGHRAEGGGWPQKLKSPGWEEFIPGQQENLPTGLPSHCPGFPGNPCYP